MEVYSNVDVSIRVRIDGSEKSAAGLCHFHRQKEHLMSN